MCNEFFEHFEHPVNPEYIAEPLWQPPIPVSCFTIPGMRVYAWLEAGEFRFGPGITGCFSTTCDRSWLVEWVKRVGREEAEKTLAEKMPYGTLLHGERAKYDRDRVYNLDKCLEAVTMFQMTHDVPEWVNPRRWAQDLRQDMLAYQLWFQRVQFEPLAVEIPLRSKKYGVATRIDAFGMITIGSEGYYLSGKKQGQPKGDLLRKYACIDTKSSRKNYSSNEHAMQVLFGEHLIKENFPYTQEEEILLFNWSPKDWTANPDYTFKQHYKKSEAKALAWEELEMCIMLTKLRTKYTKGQLVISGEMTPGTDVTTLYQKRSYLDMIRDELLADLPEELRGCVA